MTHRGPFQPLQFCDSVIPAEVRAVGPTLLLCGLRCTGLDDGPFCIFFANTSGCVSNLVS